MLTSAHAIRLARYACRCRTVATRAAASVIISQDNNNTISSTIKPRASNYPYRKPLCLESNPVKPKASSFPIRHEPTRQRHNNNNNRGRHDQQQRQQPQKHQHQNRQKQKRQQQKLQEQKQEQQQHHQKREQEQEQEQQQEQQSDEELSVDDDMFPRSCWVEVTGIPPLSTLDDMVFSINEVLEMEEQAGIIDLDRIQHWKQDEPLPLLDKQDQWVEAAILTLSSLYRPTGWKLKFKNRSIVNALLQHAKRQTLHCVWKPIALQVCDNDNNETKRDTMIHAGDLGQFEITNATLRIENCPPTMSVDHTRHLLRRYDLSRNPPAILKRRLGNGSIAFLVNFDNASWARAAIRELQGVNVLHGRYQLRFCPYPKQLLLDP